MTPSTTMSAMTPTATPPIAMTVMSEAAATAPPAPQVADRDPPLEPGRQPQQLAQSGRRHRYSGRMAGKRITSRMEGWPVSSMSSRSTPTPSPPVGGIPYSRARR